MKRIKWAYEKTCNQCGYEFKFHGGNITINTRKSAMSKTVDKKPVIKKKLFGKKYNGIVTIKKTIYNIQYSYILCPLCSHENIIRDEISKTKIHETVETKIENEFEMFGPNPPNIVGEQEAIKSWLTR